MPNCLWAVWLDLAAICFLLISTATIYYEHGHGKHLKNTEQMNALIQAEDEDINNPSNPSCHTHHSCCVSKKQNTAINLNNSFSSLHVEEALDADDNNFIGSESSSQSSSSGPESNTPEILNVKVSHFWLLSMFTNYFLQLVDVLPMKTIPPYGGNSNSNVHHLHKNVNTKSK